MTATVQYQGFSGLATWWSNNGDGTAVDVEFKNWIDTVNANASQLNRQIQYYFGPAQAADKDEDKALGSLAAFPQSSFNDDMLWFGWWSIYANGSGTMRVQMFNDWTFGPFNNGYGKPATDAIGTEVNLGHQGRGTFRGYLIGQSVEDNKEFFCVGWDTGAKTQYHNTMIIFKGTNGVWATASYSNTSNTALCYSTTNNSWNLNSNSKVTSPTVMLPVVHSFTTSTAQDYIFGEFTAQASNEALYFLGQTSEFGAYADLQDATYIVSMGYNSFWIRYDNTTTPIEPPPTTFVVTVVDAGGNKFAIDGAVQDTLQFTPGQTYVFDQSDASNTSHPIGFYEDENKTIPFTDGVTTTGFAGAEGGKTTIVVPGDIAVSQLYYQCQVHQGMGGLIEVV